MDVQTATKQNTTLVTKNMQSMSPNGPFKSHNGLLKSNKPGGSAGMLSLPLPATKKNKLNFLLAFFSTKADS